MYGQEGGAPIVMAGSGDSGMFGGGGTLGGLLLGALFAGNGGGLFGGNRGVAGADLAATQGIQNQLNGLQNQITSQGTMSEINELEGMVSNGTMSLLQGQNGIGRDALIGIGGVNTAIAAANYTNLVNTNGLGRDITAQNYNNSLQTLNSFNQLSTTLLQGINELGRDTMNSTNQILAGQAAQNAFMCQCCCDLKETVHADGEATRALINSQFVSNLQSQLTAANAALQTNTIINSLRPAVVA